MITRITSNGLLRDDYHFVGPAFYPTVIIIVIKLRLTCRPITVAD